VTTTAKVLGQSAPAATTATTLYTVPSSTQTTGYSLTVCNRSAESVTYRIAVRPAGAGLATSHYIVYDAVITANDTVVFTLGLTLATTDVVTVYASTANLTFSLFGIETS
jgi:hypothetical protein